jgi:hypothetical protein
MPLLLRWKAAAVLLALAAVLGWQTRTCLLVRARGAAAASVGERLQSWRLPFDVRLRNALRERTPAFLAIREHTPLRATVGIYGPLHEGTPAGRATFDMVNIFLRLLYPRRVDHYLPLVTYFTAHPEKLDDRVYALNVYPDQHAMDLQNFFELVRRGEGWSLWRFRGPPK